MAKQTRRRDSHVRSFMCSDALWAQIQEAIASQNRRSTKAPLNQSEWIRRAIERDLDHRRRSRSKGSHDRDSLREGVLAVREAVPTAPAAEQAYGPDGGEAPAVEQSLCILPQMSERAMN